MINAFAFVSIAGLHQYGDTDLDDDVDITDFNSLSQNFGGGYRNWHQGNFDGDEGVDISGFSLLANHFSPDGYEKLDFLEAQSTIPEPRTMFLMVVGSVILFVWTRNRLGRPFQLPIELAE